VSRPRAVKPAPGTMVPTPLRSWKTATMRSSGEVVVRSGVLMAFEAEGAHEDFEKAAAAKLDKHLKGLRVHDATKDAVDKRRAEHQAFRKDIAHDRAVVLDRALAEVNAARAKNPPAAEMKVLDKAKAKLERLIAELRQAEKTGVLTHELLPSCFDLGAESAP
jgi:hypothetical protein